MPAAPNASFYRQQFEIKQRYAITVLEQRYDEHTGIAGLELADSFTAKHLELGVYFTCQHLIVNFDYNAGLVYIYCADIDFAQYKGCGLLMWLCAATIEDVCERLNLILTE